MPKINSEYCVAERRKPFFDEELTRSSLPLRVLGLRRLERKLHGFGFPRTEPCSGMRYSVQDGE